MIKSAGHLGCIALVAWWGQGCGAGGCVRNSDCGAADTCHAGSCMPRAADGGSLAPGSGSGGASVMPRADAAAVDAGMVDAGAVDASSR